MKSQRPVISIAVSVAVFIGGVFLGFQLLTASADVSADEPRCSDRTVAEGEMLTANLVRVNVLNASGREGLANRVNINLQRKGFLAGSIGNSDRAEEVPAVAIVSDDPDDPRVQLVALQFPGEVPVIEPDSELPDGITVIVGPGYEDLDEAAPTEIVSNRTVHACVPIVVL